MLNVFIIYASKDSDLFKEFKNYLSIALYNKKLNESIKISSMDDFPSGKSSIKSNRKALRENSTFLVLNSPSLQESRIITEFELPSLYRDSSKEIIPIQFLETPAMFDDDTFLKTIQFFIPKMSYIKILVTQKDSPTLLILNLRECCLLRNLLRGSKFPLITRKCQKLLLGRSLRSKLNH